VTLTLVAVAAADTAGSVDRAPVPL